MKNPASTTHRPLTLATLLVLALTALPAFGGTKGWSHQDRIEGVWNARVYITACPTDAVLTSFDAMGMFAADGSFHDTSANTADRSPGFGTWRHIRGNRYEFAFKLFRFDPVGTPLGSQIVRHEVVLARRGDSYRSRGTAEFYDTDGNLVMEGCSTSTATRFE